MRKYESHFSKEKLPKLLREAHDIFCFYYCEELILYGYTDQWCILAKVGTMRYTATPTRRGKQRPGTDQHNSNNSGFRNNSNHSPMIAPCLPDKHLSS
uniref:Uncharacterized protein n=1 Tax=Picea sitchensis TaxID=3332 RepID=A0A6B9XRW2_PICSI|nr:hypothetical protein Q903MT_gene6736 [Picea sitchensis]